MKCNPEVRHGRVVAGARAELTDVARRSPSPEPIYSTDGKRLNTREYRTRRKLEEERHRLVTRMQQINPEFKPPPDYKYVTSLVLASCHRVCRDLIEDSNLQRTHKVDNSKNVTQT